MKPVRRSNSPSLEARKPRTTSARWYAEHDVAALRHGDDGDDDNDHDGNDKGPRAGLAWWWAQSRVVKRLRADQHGALKLARRYGEALVCVRYRHDLLHRRRYTTIELVVDEAPIQRRPDDNVTVGVLINPRDAALLEKVRLHGAKFDARMGLWRMPRHVARRLHLLHAAKRTFKE